MARGSPRAKHRTGCRKRRGTTKSIDTRGDCVNETAENGSWQEGISRPNSTENWRNVCRRENRKEAKSIDSSADCAVVKEVSAGQTALKTGEMRAGEEAGGTSKSIDTSRDYVVGKEVCQRARNGVEPIWDQTCPKWTREGRC